ncbi:dimethyl sulfoxide reductase subunit [Salmonella enterica subsp. enterica serovar Typhi]|nr:dimethyl sulfoxide reductase subunit [Salmonella enterica subsp. enterica serovar Typhi]
MAVDDLHGLWSVRGRWFYCSGSGAARGIQHGDTVRVFNQNGEMLIPAKVTPRILPGVTAIGQGAWLNADMFGDKVDRGGSINILTSHRPSPLAKGNPSHSNLVQVEKA